MSFDRRYALLGRIFLGAVGVCVVSVVVLIGVGLYGDQAQALAIVQTYRRYSVAVVLSLRYAIASRGLGGYHQMIWTVLLGGHAVVMLSYVLLVAVSVPRLVYAIVMGLIAVSVVFGRWSRWWSRLIAVGSGCISLVVLAIALVPLYPHRMDIARWFDTQEISLTIQYRDTAESLRDAEAQIWIYSGVDMRTIDLSTQSTDSIVLLSGQTVVYAAKSSLLQSWVTIHGRDGSMISLMPQTSITIGDMIGEGTPSSYQMRHIINQGTIVLHQYVLYDRPDGWLISLNNRRSVACAQGIVTWSPNRVLTRCEQSWQEQLLTQTGAGSGMRYIENYRAYSGAIWYQQTTTGWSVMTGSTTTGTMMMTGYDTIRAYHALEQQQYRNRFDQWLTQKTSRWLSPSEEGEMIVWYKTWFFARIWPLEYYPTLSAYNTYLFAKGEYQGGPLDVQQTQRLALMRKR